MTIWVYLKITSLTVYLCVGGKKHLSFSNSTANYSTNAACSVLVISEYSRIFFLNIVLDA